MIGQFSRHSTLGKISLIFAILTIVFFILVILSVVLAIVFANTSIAVFSSIFNLLMFIFSILSLILGAISFWGKDNDRYGLYAFIIGIVFLILTFVMTIAVAATVYVYVSGMIGSPEHAQTPNLAALVTPDSGNNATLLVTYIDTDDVYWPDITFKIHDITDDEYLTEYTDYTTNLSYDTIENGDSIKFTGQGNEFQENHYYSITLLYWPTDQTICYYSWEQ